MSAALAEALAQRRQDFADALEAIGLPDHHRLTLTAACEGVAKAKSVDAVAQFIDARKLAKSTEPN